MKSKGLLILNIVLAVAAIFFAWKIYRIVLEPIEFERIERQHMCVVTERMEQIREAQLAYKSEYGEYTGDFATLINFVQNGRVTIYERKDSTFKYYDKVYQQEMNRDTVVTRVLGQEAVIDRFPEGFDPANLRKVPMAEGVEFTMAAGKIDRGGIQVPVFSVSVTDVDMLKGVKHRFERYIKKDHTYEIGSLTEATISGNYENTKCKDGSN